MILTSRLLPVVLLAACPYLACSQPAHPATPDLHGHWAGVLQKLENGEDNTLYLTLDQEGAELKGEFHSMGYGGKLHGTLEKNSFILFEPWDGKKPFCKGRVEGGNLIVDIGWRSPFPLTPTEESRAPAPAFLPPPALHKVHRNALARTPPMGWNSWNHFAGGVTDANVRSAADALVSTGMRDAGYTYVNIDDTWEGLRDASGVLQPNQKFPDMKALADYVHARGLKLGIYSSPGPRTCGGYPGSYGHEELDNKTWAAWGIDYVKYDWCSAADIYSDADLQAVYQRIGDAIAATGRPMIYSLCEYGTNHVETWGADVGANLWRTTGDIRDEYPSMMSNASVEATLTAAAGPGHWNDPDMLEVGNGGMTPEEYRAHMSLWALLAAPLLSGNDLSAMSPETVALLTEHDVIAIDQDVLGIQATRIFKDAHTEIWRRSLAHGAVAVGIFNLDNAPASAKLPLSTLKLQAGDRISDIWRHQPPHIANGYFETTLAPHGVVLLQTSAGSAH